MAFFIPNQPGINGGNLFQELLILFASSFVSATLFPGGSELLLIYYLKNNPGDLWLYFSSVTLGNSLGALLSYFMGYYLHWGREKAAGKHQKSWLFCQRYGAAALLFSWLPVVGDLLPLVGGWLKLAMLPSMLLIVIGKALRYWAIVSASLYFL